MPLRMSVRPFYHADSYLLGLDDLPNVNGWMLLCVQATVFLLKFVLII
jgi:hypothetical protein